MKLQHKVTGQYYAGTIAACNGGPQTWMHNDVHRAINFQSGAACDAAKRLVELTEGSEFIKYLEVVA